MKRAAGLVVGLLISVAANAAFAWTTPVGVSHYGPEMTRPKIARGSNNSMHITWINKSDWRVFYRYRASNGAWGSEENVSGNYWAARPDVAEDNLGRTHIFYTGTGVNTKNDLYEAVKINGAWSISMLAGTSDYYEDYPRVMTGPDGRMHLVYTKSYSEDTGNIIYRVWQNGNWSGETAIGSTHGKNFYHRPDISVDSANNVHIVWAQDSYTLIYRKFNGVSWSSPVVVGSTSQFFSYPKIVAASPSNILVVTFNQLSESQPAIQYNFSNDGGASWGTIQYLNDGHYPSLDASAGAAHLVYQWNPANYTGYRRWNGTG